MMRDVMVDLETLGQVPGCAILSIGACGFDASGVDTSDVFDIVVDRASCAAVGLHEDPGTLAWWEKQGEAAQAVLAQSCDDAIAVPIERALTEFSFWLQRRFGPEVRIWGNGADFDNAILAVAYRAIGMKPYWRFWNGRCYRTLKGQRPDIKLQRHGDHHRALDDAISQARHAVELLRA